MQSFVSLQKDLERRVRMLEKRSSEAMTGAVRLKNVNDESMYSGGLVAGSAKWDPITGLPTEGTGIIFNEKGLFGIKNGTTVFSIVDGSAFISMNLQAGDMIIGTDVNGTNDGIYINADNYWYDTGLFRLANGVLAWDGSILSIGASATFAGSLSAATGTFTGGIFTSTVTGSVFNGNIFNGGSYIGGTFTGGVMTGAIIQTRTSGYRVKLTDQADLLFLLDDTIKGGIKADDGNSIIYSSEANHIFFGASGDYLGQINSKGINLKGGAWLNWQSGRQLQDWGWAIAVKGDFIPEAGRSFSLGNYRNNREWHHLWCYQGHFSNDAWADNWYTNSDKKIKKEIKAISKKKALSIILKLNGKNYRMKDVKKGDGLRAGFIAQEVKKIIPEVVEEEKDDKDKKRLLGINYMAILPYVVEAIKELNGKIDELKTLQAQKTMIE